MISSTLLDKTRAINNIVQESQERYTGFADILDVLKKVTDANTYIVDQQGSILEHSLKDNLECEIMTRKVLSKGFFPIQYNEFLLENDQLRYNLQQKSNNCVFMKGSQCLFPGRVVAVVPLFGDGKRQGTLLLARFTQLFEIDDIIVSELCAVVVGMKMMRIKLGQDDAEERCQATARLAVKNLSYFEMQAVQNIFENGNGSEKIIIARNIADRLGITRSVVGNALRKLTSAGILESNNLGRKGTYIKLLNPYFVKNLKH